MRANRRSRGCLTTTVIAVVLLGAAAVIADRGARWFTQNAAAAAIHTQLDTTGLSIDVRGIPFLTQLIDGTLDDVRASADSATFDGLSATDIQATATGVRVRDDQRAAHVTISATVGAGTLQELLRQRTGWDLDLSIADGHLIAGGAVLGIPVSVAMEVSADGGLSAQIVEASVGGIAVNASALPNGIGATIADLSGVVDNLPAGARITGAQIIGDGLRLTLEADDVAIDDL